ncbi:oligosaccharide flippase family protein [Virgibacillus halodenitrificans]|uniref:oligosaccharide flippase family protein n=1 Tax=Virgibacillus halodenitrificans TaxID=1482 RepID=UPI00155D9FD3
MFRNSSFNVIATLINIVTFVFLTPFLISQLGVEIYGVYLTITAITGFMSIMDLGIAGSSVRQFSHYYALKDFKKFNIVYSLSMLIYVILGLIIFCIIYIIVNTNFITLLFDQENLNFDNLKIALLLSSGTVFLNMVLLVNSNVSMALQKNHYYALGKIIITITEALFAVIFVTLNYNIIGLVIAKLISIFTGVIVFQIINKKLVKSIRVVFIFDKVLLKDLVSFGFYNSISQLSNGLIGQLDKIIISSFLGPEFVTYYSIPMSVTQRIHGLVATASNVIFPVTSQLQATNKLDVIKDLYKRTQNFVLVISSILIIPFVLFAHDILSIWLGNQFATQATDIFIIILISYIVIGSNIPTYFMFNGLNLPKYNAIYSLITAVIKTMFTLILINYIGILGAAVSLLISTISVPIFIYVFERKISSNRFHFLFKGYFPVSIALTIILMLKKSIFNNIDSLLLLIFSSVFFMGVYCLLLYLIGYFRINNLVFTKPLENNLLKRIFKR